MKYRHLGNSGLKISRISLGTMHIGEKAWGCDEQTAHEIAHAFLDAGGNFVDTADLYGYEVTEVITGRALKKRRHEVVLATKCCRYDKDGFDL